MEAAAASNEAIRAKYTKETKVGEGTYAVVYLGHEHATGRKIAIKKIKVGQFKDGLDMSAIREVKFLRELSHPNVISLLDVFSSKQNLNLVLEYLDTDLEAIIRDRTILFQGGDVKSWMVMMLQGLEFCHRNFVLHRDMKPNNLLISGDGTLKLADFGLAREYADAGIKMSTQVVTRWYRPPELLFGARTYSTPIDVWSAGCIFAELMLRVPFMAGESDVHQLEIMFQALGTPEESEWPGYKKLPQYVEFKKVPKPPLGSIFTAASGPALDLLSKLLLWDPRKRISCRDAIKHPYFLSAPFPTHPSKLPMPSGPQQPRELPPAEFTQANGIPKSKKRPKDSDDEDGNEAKVARKLDFR